MATSRNRLISTCFPSRSSDSYEGTRMANLPISSDTQPLRKPTIPKDAAVLVVEDNVSNFVLIARMLGYLGIHCEWKTSGYEVLEYADTLPAWI